MEKSNINVDKNNENGCKFSIGCWSSEENEKFKQAVFYFGNDWKSIQKYINSRTISQCKSHSQKYFNKLKNKFYKECNLIKLPITNEMNYANIWIKKLIENTFLPLIKKIDMHHNNKISNLQKLILKKIISKKLINDLNKKKIRTCTCKFGNRECDCDENCCKKSTSLNVSHEMNDSLEIVEANYKSKVIKDHIFKVEKIKNESNFHGTKEKKNNQKIKFYLKFDDSENQSNVENNKMFKLSQVNFDKNLETSSPEIYNLQIEKNSDQKVELNEMATNSKIPITPEYANNLSNNFFYFINNHQENDNTFLYPPLTHSNSIQGHLKEISDDFFRDHFFN